MSIVKLWDETEFYVTPETAEDLKLAIRRGIDHVEIGENWLRASAISQILPGGTPPNTYREANNTQIATGPAVSDLTEAQLQHRLETIQAMKQKMLQKSQGRNRHGA